MKSVLRVLLAVSLCSVVISTPTAAPTALPTASPSFTPSAVPSRAPTRIPTVSPTQTPSRTPSRTPTANPSFSPTATPTFAPSALPTMLLNPQGIYVTQPISTLNVQIPIAEHQLVVVPPSGNALISLKFYDAVTTDVGFLLIFSVVSFIFFSHFLYHSLYILLIHLHYLGVYINCLKCSVNTVTCQSTDNRLNRTTPG
jgi:hypothetical protein